MEQFKRVKAVMLPTNNKANIGSIFKCTRLTELHDPEIDVKIGQLVVNKNTLVTKTNNYFEHQHLYIISDDEIKKGDWCVNENNNIFQYIGGLLLPTDKKIIATTDTFLNIKCNKDCTNYMTESCSNLCFNSTLPQPSQQFIEKYIECYNKGEVITDILVEYEDKVKDKFTSFDTGKLIYFEPKFKINPKDNTITIKKLKDSWNREEIIAKMKLALQKGIYLEATVELDFDEDKWIEENL